MTKSYFTIFKRFYLHNKEVLIIETGSVIDLGLNFYKDAKINSINMRNQEVLYVDPTDDVKNRSVGVVALAVYMHAAGYKVRLVTNSREIERLAILQGCDIDVTRIKKVW